MKSNGNGTYFGISLDNVNRNDRGFVDFEKFIGLDGIALVNIVSNPETASVSGRKEIQTRITHNDGKIIEISEHYVLIGSRIGGSWRPLSPPTHDSLGRQFDCTTTARDNVFCGDGWN